MQLESLTCRFTELPHADKWQHANVLLKKEHCDLTLLHHEDTFMY